MAALVLGPLTGGYNVFGVSMVRPCSVMFHFSALSSLGMIIDTISDG